MNQDDVPIARPCPPGVSAQDFEPRGPDSLYCKVCKQHVYDLSAMTDFEATAFVKLNAEALPCVTYTTDINGQLVHVPEGRLRRRSPGAVALFGASALMAACNANPEPLREGPTSPTATAAPAVPSHSGVLRGGMRMPPLVNSSPECRVPYVIDEQGIKRAKMECLAPARKK
jgi:hypothetical protein